MISTKITQGAAPLDTILLSDAEYFEPLRQVESQGSARGFKIFTPEHWQSSHCGITEGPEGCVAFFDIDDEVVYWLPDDTKFNYANESYTINITPKDT